MKDSSNRLSLWTARIALLLLGMLGLGLLALSILGLVGQFPTPVGPIRQHLSATDFASSAVAGATLMLAVFTAYLAIATRASVAATRREAAIAEQALAAAQETARIGAEQVRATNRHAEIAQETLEASWRPLLVDVPFGFAKRTISNPPGLLLPVSNDLAQVTAVKRDDGTGRAVVPFRNIGSGPGIITKALLSLGQLHTEATSFSSSIVAVNEVVRIFFDLTPGRATVANLISQIAEGRPFTVTVFYGDQGGGGEWRSTAQLHRPAGAGDYEVLNVKLYEGDSDKPFATSGGGTP